MPSPSKSFLSSYMASEAFEITHNLCSLLHCKKGVTLGLQTHRTMVKSGFFYPLNKIFAFFVCLFVFLHVVTALTFNYEEFKHR